MPGYWLIDLFLQGDSGGGYFCWNKPQCSSANFEVFFIKKSSLPPKPLSKKKIFKFFLNIEVFFIKQSSLPPKPFSIKKVFKIFS